MMSEHAQGGRRVPTKAGSGENAHREWDGDTQFASQECEAPESDRSRRGCGGSPRW
jgi:hypothetical protein